MHRSISTLRDCIALGPESSCCTHYHISFVAFLTPEHAHALGTFESDRLLDYITSCPENSRGPCYHISPVAVSTQKCHSLNYVRNTGLKKIKLSERHKSLLNGPVSHELAPIGIVPLIRVGVMTRDLPSATIA